MKHSARSSPSQDDRPTCSSVDDRWLSWNLACCESLEDRTPPHLEILRHDKWTGIELLWISLVGDSAAAVDLLALIGHILVDRKNRQQLAHEEAALLLGSLEIAIMAASKWPIAEQTPFDELQNALVLLRIVKLLLRSGTDFNHLETIKTHSYDICEALNRLDINFAAVYFNVLSRCTQLETFEDRGASTISGLTASMHLVASTTCNIGFDKGGIAMISHHIPDEPMSIALYSASDMEYKMHFDEIELRFLMSRRSGDVRQHLQDPITFDFNEPDIMLFFWTEFEDKMRLVADNRMTTDGLASRNACVISHPSETRP